MDDYQQSCHRSFYFGGSEQVFLSLRNILQPTAYCLGEAGSRNPSECSLRRHDSGSAVNMALEHRRPNSLLTADRTRLSSYCPVAIYTAVIVMLDGC